MSSGKPESTAPPTSRKTSLLNNPVYIQEVNKRNNAGFALFTNYQVNPYTKKTRKLLCIKNAQLK